MSNHTKACLNTVELGASYIIIRNGRPIAILKPFGSRTEQGWKRDSVKVKLRGERNSADLVREERDER